MRSKIKPLYVDFSFFVGMFLLFFAFCILGAGLDKLVGNFLDVPSVAISVFGAAGYLLLAFEIEAFLNSLKVIVIGAAETKNDVVTAINFCSCTWKTCLVCSAAGVLIGWINMLSGGLNYERDVLCNAIAISVITILYGLIIAGLFISFKYRCKRILNNLESSEEM